MKLRRRLVVASNRLPVTASGSGGRVNLIPSDGGLIRAMTSILQDSGGRWIGWPGCTCNDGVTKALDDWASAENYSLHPVSLSEAEQNGYYKGFSNEILWPLFHGFSDRCCFNFDYWNHYRNVNIRFATTIAAMSSSEDLVWIHDYHLMLVASVIKDQGLLRDLAYFHHIPFPAPDIFEILPWRVPILRGLLEFNVVGFQAARHQRNFIDCVQCCLPDARVSQTAGTYQVEHEGHSTTVGVYPISIDYGSFADSAMNPAVQDRLDSLKRSLGGSQLILGVDRLDYTKGIIERLSAYRNLLSRYPELRERVTLIQIMVPSREDIAEYQQLRQKIETLISNINGEYAKPGWAPIRYVYSSVSQTHLAAYYLAADVVMVTPLRDGMNLVAKEFCASRSDGRGALILSEFAGAANELGVGAFIVNPHDVDGLTDVLHRVLSLNESDQAIRMQAMRLEIETHDIYRWADMFITDCLRTTELLVNM